MTDDMELRLRRYFSSVGISGRDAEALGQLAARAALRIKCRRSLAVPLRLAAAAATLAVMAAFVAGFVARDPGFVRAQLSAIPIVYMHPTPRSTSLRSQPTTWEAAKKAAADAGYSLVEPTWLPFQSEAPQVQQAIPPGKPVEVTNTLYQSATGDQYVLMTQRHSRLTNWHIENVIGSVEVGGVEATLTKHTVGFRGGSYDALGVFWQLPDGEGISIDSRGLTEAELIKVAESVR